LEWGSFVREGDVGGVLVSVNSAMRREPFAEHHGFGELLLPPSLSPCNTTIVANHDPTYTPPSTAVERSVMS